MLCKTADNDISNFGRMLSRQHGSRLNKAGFDDEPVTQRRKTWLAKTNKALPAGQALSAKCKPRHIVRLLRDGTPGQRAATNVARDSSNTNYGTGSTAQGAAQAAAAAAATAE